MKTLVGLIVLFGFCIFMGVTAISMGVGAIFPDINRIAQPVLCPGGEMFSETSVRSPLPGRTYVSSSYTCVDASGARTPMQGVALVAGPIQGLCLFAGFLPLVLLRALGRRAPAAPPPPLYPNAPPR